MSLDLGEQRVGSRGLKETFRVAVGGKEQDIPRRGNTAYVGIMVGILWIVHRIRGGIGAADDIGHHQPPSKHSWVQEYFFTLQS